MPTSFLRALALVFFSALSAVGAEPGKQFVITQNGAVADGATLNTAAIQRTIDTAAAAGGGTVVIPRGTFISGAIFLKPGVHLHLVADAVLRCSNDMANFPPQRTRIEGHFEESFNPALINADGCDGLHITGAGVLDGAGRPVWDLFWKLRGAAPDKNDFKNLSVARARLALIQNSRGVVIEGVTFKDSQFWNLHLYKCRDVLVRNARFLVPDDYKQAPSSDGIDVDSCQDVAIKACHFSVTDDCIALKGSKGPLALEDKDSPPVERVRISDCIFQRGHAAVTLGSEATVVKDVVVESCKVLGAMAVINFKLRSDTPQRYEGIHYRNITLEGTGGSLLSIQPWKQYADLQGQTPPKSVVRNLTVADVAGSYGSFGVVQGIPGQTEISDITLENIEVKLKSEKLEAVGVRNLQFEDVTINGRKVTAPVAAQEAVASSDPLAWPRVTKENMPGTRWWWMGSAVNPVDLARELKTYREAGLGTVEITPIYGVKGSEDQFIEYLSPRWMEMLQATVTEAQKLDMNVDMVTGTGWCFGGPNVSDQDANAFAVYKGGSVSQKPSGQKVKRPAPGGEGWMLNLLYPDAMTRYLQKFSDAFAKYDGPKPRAQFHDSYEYKSDWAPDFFEQFEKHRGYQLQGELPALFEGQGDPEHVARVKGDYRQTVSDLIEESIVRWTKWSHERGFLSRNQAHGSPGNWLDIYAASDIPETEIDFFNGGDIGISKFASSAAHVTGKNLVSSETGTWSAEHFTETLETLKSLCDDFFLAGVNRIMWHGTTYSPADAPWPGWCFYASTEMNPRNAIWHDVPALHAYLARVQSLMQSGRPDNDVLLYWPIHDFWHDPEEGRVQPMSVHGREWFGDQAIGKTAEMLWKRGYAFDYISDKLLQNAKAEGGTIELAGSKYRALVVPGCEHMPLETMKKLVALADAGVVVIFADRTPKDVPGLHDLEKRRAECQALASKLSATPGDQLDAALGKAGVRREQALTDHEGVQFVRRAVDGGVVYFIANRGPHSLNQPIKLASADPQAALLDPMTGRTGLAEIANGAVRLQLDPGQSLLVRTFANRPGAARWSYREPSGEPITLTGQWNVKFVEGGPSLPKPFSTDKLTAWTELGGAETQSFAGTALYTLRFAVPSSAQRWTLHLGKVVQSARVRVNGRDLGTVFTPPFRVSLESLKPQDNVLEVEVTGTSANRIRDLDVRGVNWKIFYDTNVVTRKYKPFDASKWPIAEQGLIGPVTLQAERAPK